MIKIALLVIVVLVGTIQGATQPTDNNQNNVLKCADGYVSILTELVVNFNKILRYLASNLGKNSTGSDLLVLATANETQSCTSTEGQNLVTLFTNTTQALEQCVSNFTSDGGTLVYGIYNVLSNVTQVITNTTSNITQCVENSTHHILSLPQCIISQLQYVTSDISAIVNQLNNMLRTAVNTVGNVASTARSCIVNIVAQFLSSIYNILIDFVACVEEL